MKIPDKRELQLTAFNHSSDIDSKDFINLYKKCIAKPCFCYSLILIMKTIMTIYDKIRDKETKI